MAENGSRVVVITGSSSGIGRATARLFARRGWRVGLVARSAEGLELTRKDVEGEGSQGCIAVADVADSAALRRAADHIEETLGPIDVWINDAGVAAIAPFRETTEDEFRRVNDVTYMGTVNGVRTALQHLTPRNRGVIVNVVSAIAFRGAPLMSAYSGAKYAIRGFTEALRSELVHDKVNVHIANIYPPAVNTPFFSHAPTRWTKEVPRPPPPAYQPEIIADAIYYAVLRRKRDVVVGGQSVQLQLLNRLAPKTSDWLIGKFGYAMQKSTKRKAKRMYAPSLFAPTEKIHAVRGPWFAFERSAQFWATRNRSTLAAIGIGAGFLAWLSWAPKGQRIASRH